jgi:hypothetical protein
MGLLGEFGRDWVEELKVVKDNWVLCVGIIGDCLGVDVRRWSVLLVRTLMATEADLFCHLVPSLTERGPLFR